MTDTKEIELKFFAEHGKEAIDTISYSSFVFPCHFLTNETKDNFKSGRSINYYTGILNDIAMPTNKYDYYRLIIGTICMGNWLGFTPIYEHLSSFHDMDTDENVTSWDVLKDIKSVCNEFWVTDMLGGNPNENLVTDYPFIHKWIAGVNNLIKDKINEHGGSENTQRQIYQNMLQEARKDLFKNIEIVRSGKSNIIDIKDQVEYWRTRIDFQI